jgi:hypothetical protein
LAVVAVEQEQWEVLDKQLLNQLEEAVAQDYNLV